MIKTKWILSCMMFALGTLLTASAQAQNFATTINTTRFGNPQGTYNVTLTQGPTNTYAVSVVQTGAPGGLSTAFVDALSFAFVDAANNPVTILSSTGQTTSSVPPFLVQPFVATPLPNQSVALSDNIGGTPGPNANSLSPGANTSLNSFNSYSGTITVASAARGVTIGLTGNGGSGNNFASNNVVPESNASLLLLAALLPIGMIVARRRSSVKSAI